MWGVKLEIMFRGRRYLKSYKIYFSSSNAVTITNFLSTKMHDQKLNIDSWSLLNVLNYQNLHVICKWGVCGE